MPSDMNHAFIQKITDDTRNHRLEWHYMDTFTDAYKMIVNPSAAAAVFPGIEENMYFQIDYHRSYACMTNAGVVYLFYCHSFDGVHTQASSEFRLAIHPMPYDTRYYCNIYADQPDLFKLETAIRKHKDPSDQYWIHDSSHFISLYLSNRDSDEHLSAPDSPPDN